MYKGFYIFLFILNGLLVSEIVMPQNYTRIDELSRDEKIILLHRLDSLIYYYEFYGSLMEGISFTEYRINQFRDLFFYKDATIFDDATPNYQEEDEDVIWEKQKNFDEYVNDIKSFYNRISINLSRADLGDPLEKARIENGSIIIPVQIEKELSGYTEGKGDFQTSSVLMLTTEVPVRDFLFTNPKIGKIEKQNTYSCKWNYTPPPQKISRFKTTLFLKGSYAHMFLNDQIAESFMKGSSQKGDIAWSAIGELRFNAIDQEFSALGFSIGAGPSFYRFSYIISEYEYINQDFESDKDNDNFLRIVYGKNIVENWSLLTLDIPFHLNLELAFGRMGVYSSVGPCFSHFIKKDYNTSGIFDYRGFYPKYNWLADNVPEYGFQSDVSLQKTGTLDLNKPYYLSIDVAAGISIRFPKARMLLYAGLSIQNSMPPFTKSKENSYITNYINQVESILNEKSNAHLVTYGFQIGVRKYIKRISAKKTVMRYGTY